MHNEHMSASATDGTRMGRYAPVLVVGAGVAGLGHRDRAGPAGPAADRGRARSRRHPGPARQRAGDPYRRGAPRVGAGGPGARAGRRRGPALRSADTLADADDVVDLAPGGGPDVISPTTPVVVGEDVLESVLRAHLQAYGVPVVSGLELASLRQDELGVTAVLGERRTRRRLTVQARYVVGADGDGARVRALLDVAVTGPDQLERYVSTLFRAPLARLAPTSAQYAATAVLAPEGIGIFQPVGGDDRWLFSSPRPPWLPSAADDGRAARERMVRAASGVPDLDVYVLDVTEHRSRRRSPTGTASGVASWPARRRTA